MSLLHTAGESPRLSGHPRRLTPAADAPAASLPRVTPAVSPARRSRQLDGTEHPVRRGGPLVSTAPPAAQRPAETDARRASIRAVPEGTEARGFVLYVGIDEAKAASAGTDLSSIVEALKALTTGLAPGAETYAAVALAPRGAGGRDVDVVRLALQDPAAIARHRATEDLAEPEPSASGVVVDISRKRLLIDNVVVGLTYKEFELLQFLVLREGRTVERGEIISSLWSSSDDDIPNERTIDVHVRRLRAKLDRYQDIVRTVRGVGYRFDRHADVSIRYASAPSPDLF